LEAVQQLDGARTQGRAGLTMAQLTQALRVDALLLEPVLETLVELDWLGLLQEEKAEDSAGVAARYVLLANPDTTALAPLIDALLLKQDAATKNLWDSSAWHQLTLRQAL